MSEQLWVDCEAIHRRSFFKWTAQHFTSSYLAAFLGDEAHHGPMWRETSSERESLDVLLNELFDVLEEYDSFSNVALEVLKNCPKQLQDSIFTVQQSYSSRIDAMKTKIERITESTHTVAENGSTNN